MYLKMNIKIQIYDKEINNLNCRSLIKQHMLFFQNGISTIKNEVKILSKKSKKPI